MANEVKFIEISKSSFDSLSSRNDNALYVVKDASKRYIYKGNYLLGKNFEDKIEVIRIRAKNTNLTSVNSGDTSGYVSCNTTLSVGDRLLIEVADYSGAGYNSQIIGITVGKTSSSPNSTDDDLIASWTTWNGTKRVTYSFSLSYSGTNLYFGSKKCLEETFSGSSISVTTSIYTLYVGQIWRLND